VSAVNGWNRWFGDTDSSNFNLLCSAPWTDSSAARIFRAALPAPQSSLQTAAGHAVPTRRALSARRVTLTDTATAAAAALRAAKPATKPTRPYFSSGPCAKPPGWIPQALDTSALGRSHRGTIGKARLADASIPLKELG